MTGTLQQHVAKRLYRSVRQLCEATAELERQMHEEIARVAPDQRASARNLVHYLAVRRRDIRELQSELSQLGLSSLGRLEAHVDAALEAVLLALARIADEPSPRGAERLRPTSFREGDERLARHTDALLGPANSDDPGVRIMVTMPSEAASDYGLVRRLVAAGMDCARINTAHDGLAEWERMALHVRAAAAEERRNVRVFFDLAGPKLRTGALVPGPEIVRVRARRDERGIVVAPAVVRLVAAGAVHTVDESAVEIPVEPPKFLDDVQTGDRIVLRDTRGKERDLAVFLTAASEALAHSMRSAWLESGLALELRRDHATIAAGRIGRLPARASVIELHEGDVLLVTTDDEPGRPAVRDVGGTVVEPARVPCAVPAVFGEVRTGERISFDDGKIGGVIEAAAPDGLRVRITRTAPRGAKLRADKGINFPDSTLTLPSLTERDIAALDLGAELADIVGLSFVRTVHDVETLHEELVRRKADNVSVVIKIETHRGFEDLPRILLAALRRPPVGVMVARGDLGVEVGFERMAEVQEQILWLCEAAHVPVIWATQVLEGLTKNGIPTRGEVTDAAMSARAECVMLNKGPHVEKAVRFLDDVFARMRDHHIKKTPMLRRLKVSEGRAVGGAVPPEADPHSR